MKSSESPYNYSKVLVLYVGGTIGMTKNNDGVYTPTPNQFINKLKFHSEMHNLELAQQHFPTIEPNELVLSPDGHQIILYKVEEYEQLLDSSNMSIREWIQIVLDIEVIDLFLFFVMAYCTAAVAPDGHQIILYKVEEYEQLLDSSNMSIREWIQIVLDIEKNYDDYNGFVILHGTDTLAYTSSALSFMLENIKKPVILTGSQISIFESRSDAKNNIATSVILAGIHNIPEVCVFFANKLFRGNRTAKTNSTLLDAFGSPNYNHLADTGVEIELHNLFILDPPTEDFRAYTQLNSNVAVLYFYPTITPKIIKESMQAPTEGVVIQSYGTGNISLVNKEILQALKDAVDREIVLVNVTQCAQGTVSSSYEGGKALEDIGVVSGFDMTVEAALTKLCFILGQPGLTYEDKIAKIKQNIRGELTSN